MIRLDHLFHQTTCLKFRPSRQVTIGCLFHHGQALSLWNLCTPMPSSHRERSIGYSNSGPPRLSTTATLHLSAHNFSNHFKPSFSQIGKPDSHGRYASQRKTPLTPLYFYPLCRITPRRTKNDIVIGEDYGTITLGIPMGYTAE